GTIPRLQRKCFRVHPKLNSFEGVAAKESGDNGGERKR
ncbi:hypothetical protein L195_g061649, partial [Trifolium pratense]